VSVNRRSARPPAWFRPERWPPRSGCSVRSARTLHGRARASEPEGLSDGCGIDTIGSGPAA